MEVELTVDNFEEEVEQCEIPVLVDFWATWCGPCKMLSPVVEEIANDYDGKIKVGKVNVDEQMDLAVTYGISVIPALMLFKGGEIVKRSEGYMSKEELIKEFGL